MKTCICCGCILGEHYTGGSVLEAIDRALTTPVRRLNRL